MSWGEDTKARVKGWFEKEEKIEKRKEYYKKKKKSCRVRKCVIAINSQSSELLPEEESIESVLESSKSAAAYTRRLEINTQSSQEPWREDELT